MMESTVFYVVNMIDWLMVLAKRQDVTKRRGVLDDMLAMYC